MELVAKLLHLPHTQLLQRVSRPVLKTAQEHSSAAGFEHPGLVALMHFADRNRNASSLLLPPPQDEDLRAPPVRPTEYSHSKQSRLQYSCPADACMHATHIYDM